MDYTVPDKIEDSLFLGKANSAAHLETLQALEITHILMVGDNLTAHFPNHFIYKHIETEDNFLQNVRQYFDECFEFIDSCPAHKNVLVHCQAGVSRSATIVIAYLMKKYKIPFEEARQSCKRRRNAVNPNKHFTAQLREFERELFSHP